MDQADVGRADQGGAFPRLGKHVLPVYVRGDPEETRRSSLAWRAERRVLNYPNDWPAPTASATGKGAHIAARTEAAIPTSIRAMATRPPRRAEHRTRRRLRHCDGEHVQALVLVRDDFWMAATRFVRDLEIRLVEGENSAAVDLFDILHAKRAHRIRACLSKVLPDRASDFTPEQLVFIEQSCHGYYSAQDGRSLSARLPSSPKWREGN